MDVEVTRSVEAESVRSREDAWVLIFIRHFEVSPLLLVRVVSNKGNGCAGFVDNNDSSLKFGDSDVVTVE